LFGVVSDECSWEHLAVQVVGADDGHRVDLMTTYVFIEENENGEQGSGKD
jgi:hypothetical protein